MDDGRSVLVYVFLNERRVVTLKQYDLKDTIRNVVESMKPMISGMKKGMAIKSVMDHENNVLDMEETIENLVTTVDITKLYMRDSIISVHGMEATTAREQWLHEPRIMTIFCVSNRKS